MSPCVGDTARLDHQWTMRDTPDSKVLRVQHFYLNSTTSRIMCVVSRSLTSLPSMVTRTVPVGGGGSFRTTTSGNGCACAYTAGGNTLPRAIFFCQPGGSALPDAGFLRCLLRMSTLCCCTISFSIGVISTCSQGGSDAGAAAE